MVFLADDSQRNSSGFSFKFRTYCRTDAFNQGWIYNWQMKGWVKSDKKPVKNVDLWKALLVAMEPHQVRFIWVKGHDGHPENERCDMLATSAADGSELLEDVELV